MEDYRARIADQLLSESLEDGDKVAYRTLTLQFRGVFIPYSISERSERFIL